MKTNSGQCRLQLGRTCILRKNGFLMLLCSCSHLGKASSLKRGCWGQMGTLSLWLMLPFPLSVWVTLGFCSGEDREGLASEYRLCLASAGLGAGSEPAAPGWPRSWSRSGLAVLCWGATEHHWAQPSSAGELLSNALR